MTAHERVGFGEEEIEVKSFKEREQTFDDKMNMIQEDRYNADGELISHIINKYDEDNHLIFSQYYNSETLLQQNEYIYEDGKLVITKSMYGEDAPEYCTHLLYENDLLVQEDDFDGDDFDHTIQRLYYEGLNVVKQVTYNDYEKVDSIQTYTYDDDGNVLTQIIEEVEAKDKRSLEFEYENGKKTKELMYDYYDKLIAAKYYQYNEAGQLIEEENEDLDNYRKLIYCYDGDVLISVTELNKEEQELSKVEYELDSEKKLTKMISYVLDEVDPSHLRIVSELSYTKV